MTAIHTRPAGPEGPTPPRTDPTVGELRHRAEVPMLVMAGVLTAIGVGVAAWAVAGGVDVPGWAQAAIIGLAMPLPAAVVFIRFQYWKEITNGVEITENQFGDIHEIYRDLAHRMGMNEIPRLYLRNGDGALNAFASKCEVRRSYVVIYSDLLDIAYEHGDFNGVRFVLAHELGHVHCGHIDLWRIAVSAVPRALFLNRSVIRAQEYTADRCAAYYAPEGASSMMALYAGKRRYRDVDLDAYHQSVRGHRDGFWLRFANFWSDHAVGFRRMEALRGAEIGGWDVHGRML